LLQLQHFYKSAFFASVCLVTCAHAGTLAMSTFTSGTEGWDSYSFVDNGEPEFTRAFDGSYPVTYNPAVGGASAYISAQDPDQGWQYFRAGPAFLGNELAALDGTFAFSIARLDTFDDAMNSPEPPPLAIAGGNLVLAYIGSVPAPTSAFTTDTIPLAANGSWVIDNVDGSFGAAATQAQLSTVLSNLTGIYILGDWFFGAGPTDGDIYGIANVSLNAGPVSATPEPATALLLGVALVALVVLGRRNG
jgi:Laminin B (Domain IV)